MDRLTLIWILIVLSNQLVFSQLATDKQIDYAYSLVIDVNDMMGNNHNNYKYLINKGWDFDSNNDLIFLKDRMMYFVTYNYFSDDIENSDFYKRRPIDTLKIYLTDSQLDSIYYYTSDIFNINDSIDIIDNDQPDDIYDGWVVKLTLELENYKTN